MSFNFFTNKTGTCVSILGRYKIVFLSYLYEKINRKQLQGLLNNIIYRILYGRTVCN